MSGTRPSGSSPRDKIKAQQEQAARRVRDRRLLGAAAIVLVLVLVGGGIGVQLWRTSRNPSAVPAAAGTASSAPVPIVDGKPIVLGAATAAVRVQLYEDFHCPHCAEFEEAFGPTLTAAQNSGRVAVELYPMAFIDQGSVAAANAMACAAEDGFGQAYYLGLFANHTLGWSDDQLVDLAAQATPTVPETFRTCVATKAHQRWVDSIKAAADSAGVTSTPTMFIDGNPVDIAALTPDSLQSMIDQAATK